MFYTKTITLNSFVDDKGYLRATDLPFYLKINRLVVTSSSSSLAKQFSVIRNDENRESLRKVELLKWLLCDDLFYLVFAQCFDISGKLKKSVIDGIESTVNYTQIMSPILNKNKRRPTTVNLLKRVSEYIIQNPKVLQKQMEHIKSNIDESEFYTSIYAADKSYYDYLVMEKAIIQGKIVESDQASAIMRILRTSYDDKYHGNNNIVKATLCRSFGWNIPKSHSEEMSFYRHLTTLVIESITEGCDELQEMLQGFIGEEEKSTGYNRWDYEKPFTELHNTIQQALDYSGELFRVSEGFLTNQFYRYLFSHAKKRLYISIPANDNLLAYETIEEFKAMMQRVKNSQLDFKCVYSNPDKSNNFLDLDPNSELLREQILKNYQDVTNCLQAMNLDPQDHVRITPVVFDTLLIVLDEILLYRKPFENGTVFSNVVNLPFYVLFANAKGAFMALEDFFRRWEIFDDPQQFTNKSN